VPQLRRNVFFHRPEGKAGEKIVQKKHPKQVRGGAGRFKMCKLVYNINKMKSENESEMKMKMKINR